MKMPSPEAGAVAKFEALVPSAPGVSVRKVFGQPAAFVNGNMFFGVFGDQVFVRLSEAHLKEALVRLHATPFEPMEGRPMRGYAVLPKAVLASTTKASVWVTRAREHALSLPPKRPKK